MGGYAPSFARDDPKGYSAFFHREGYVVIDDVLTREETYASRKELFDSLEGIDPEQPETWHQWPKTICKNGGFVGKFPFWKRRRSLQDTNIACEVQAWKNRENPWIYQIVSTLMQTQALWVSIDRYGIMRPTDIPESEPNWKTKVDWLHWDLNPFHYGTSAAGFAPNETIQANTLAESYGSLRIQCLVNLTDNVQENGGFHCVPGFINETFYQWRAENASYGQLEHVQRRNFVEVPEDDPMRQKIQKIPMREGSLLVWNSQMPHG